MHDWSIISILVLWQESIIKITLRDGNLKNREIMASDFKRLSVPKEDDWGKSISVNEILGPERLTNGNCKISIQIQSGDWIEIEAKSINMPTSEE